MVTRLRSTFGTSVGDFKAVQPRVLPSENGDIDPKNISGLVLPGETGDILVSSISNPTTGSTPKASAAPKSNAQNTFKGLAVALNDLQNRLVKAGTYEVADIYEFEFTPAALANSKVAKDGSTNKKKTPMANTNTAKNAKDPNTQSMNKTARSITANAGTPIVQFIDQILRNSTYITDQANVVIDETTQKTKPQQPLGDVTWYKISLEATPIKWDNKRKDFAYRIKYLISAYPIVAMESEYFPPAKDKGLHKTYEYWFTGKNTEVLDYEQSFNTAYTIAVSNPGQFIDTKTRTDNLVIAQRAYIPASSESGQGGEGRVNEIGANAADFLYTVDAIGRCKLKIVGDPAWIQQGEVSDSISAQNFSYSPWNPDDGINYDASQIAFNITWNLPIDYDLDTGLQNPGQDQIPVRREDNKNNRGRFSAKYKPGEIKSYFSKGSFTQVITGDLIRIPIQTTPAETTGTEAGTGANKNKAVGSRKANGNLAPKLLAEKEAAAGFPQSTAKNIPFNQPSNQSSTYLKEYESSLLPTTPKLPTSNGGVQSVVFKPVPKFGENTNGITTQPSQRTVRDQ